MKSAHALNVFSLICFSVIIAAYVGVYHLTGDYYTRYVIIAVLFLFVLSGAMIKELKPNSLKRLIFICAVVISLANIGEQFWYIKRFKINIEDQMRSGAYARAEKLIAKNNKECIIVEKSDVLFYARRLDFLHHWIRDVPEKYTDLPLCSD